MIFKLTIILVTLFAVPALADEQTEPTPKEPSLTSRGNELDKLCDDEVMAIRAAYPDIDFDAKDGAGLSLESRIVQFALNTKIYSYTMSFNLLLGERRPLPFWDIYRTHPYPFEN